MTKRSSCGRGLAGSGMCVRRTLVLSCRTFSTPGARGELTKRPADVALEDAHVKDAYLENLLASIREDEIRRRRDLANAMSELPEKLLAASRFKNEIPEK